jgi:hypothetical protein
MYVCMCKVGMGIRKELLMGRLLMGKLLMDKMSRSLYCMSSCLK